MSEKKTNATFIEFQRWFRTELRDPALEIVAKSSPQWNSFLLELLPQRLWEAIQRWERIKVPGSTKALRLRMEIETWLAGLGLKSLLPFLLKSVEMSVIWIYKEHYMAKMKQLHLDRYIEQLFKQDFDEDGAIGKKPLTAPAFIEPAPEVPKAESTPTEEPESVVKEPEPESVVKEPEPDKGPVATVERKVKNTLKTLKSTLAK